MTRPNPSTAAELSYYATATGITRIDESVLPAARLVDDSSELCRIVQGLLIHTHHAARYGLAPEERRMDELQLRSAMQILERARALDPGDLLRARPPERRVLATCRDFAVLYCALRRHRGDPARVRCGFATYFDPKEKSDHWICEEWDSRHSRWRGVDAQIDRVQRDAMDIGIDPLDVDASAFINASAAWLRCRAGADDARRYGIFDMHGLWFVQANVLRDLACLSKVELLPWDNWGIADLDEEKMGEAENALLDALARDVIDSPLDFSGVRRRYEESAELRVDSEIRSYRGDAYETIDITHLI